MIAYCVFKTFYTFALMSRKTRHDILVKIEALCSLVDENLGNFQEKQEDGMMVLRVYRVDCYFHLLLSGFPRTFIYSVAYQFHASLYIMRKSIKNFMYN